MYPLSTDMTIVQINRNYPKLSTTELLVESIGPGGLRLPDFLTPFLYHGESFLNSGHTYWVRRRNRPKARYEWRLF